MQRTAKAAAKRARRESKRQEGSGLDSMMARVDEFGDIVDIESDAPESAGDDADPAGEPNSRA